LDGVYKHKVYKKIKPKANGSFKVRRLNGRLKASIPGVQATSHQLHYIRHNDPFTAGSVHLKKPSGGPKGLIGPPCHGVSYKKLEIVLKTGRLWSFFLAWELLTKE
jgi:hypothetical protein